MLDLKNIQKQHSGWEKLNFGAKKAHQPILGMLEELGELSHAFLKREQGIRINEDHDEDIKDAIGDLFMYMLSLCSSEGLCIEEVIIDVSTQVLKRDWKNNPSLGC